MDTVNDGIRFPAIAERHYKVALDAFEELTGEDKRMQEPGAEPPRHQAKRMEFVENATVAVIAFAAALEAQIVLVGAALYGRVRAKAGADAEATELASKLAKKFWKDGDSKFDEFPPPVGVEIMTATARQLHKFARKLTGVVLDDQSAWPSNSGELADLRNHLVHRTVEVLHFDPAAASRPTTIKMLEDWEPDELHDRLLCARKTFLKCWDLMQKAHGEFDGREIEVCEAVVSKPATAPDTSS
jgi:hypothetical protein